MLENKVLLKQADMVIQLVENKIMHFLHRGASCRLAGSPDIEVSEPGLGSASGSLERCPQVIVRQKLVMVI